MTQAMRPETTSEHLARDMRDGRFPEQSEPQMVPVVAQGNKWSAAGLPDPHGTRYDCPRSELPMADLSDDELANGVYLYGDSQPPIAELLSGKAKTSGVWLDAAKNRIRWLSRKLDALAAELAAQTQRAREAEAEAHACGAEREAWKDRAEAAEAQVADLTAKLGAITEAFGYSAIDLAFLREEHAEWSQRQFGDVSAVGPAKHLSKEALEVASDPTDAIEHADCWMLLWDMQRRAGISDEQLARAIYEKLAVNKARKWPEPKEGEALEHDRAALKTGGA